jgi:FkbM family methyltransferase
MRRLKLAKRLIKVMLGKDFFPRIDGNTTYERLGSIYGGWNVALEGLDGSSIVYSFGIGEDASFDLELIGKLGVTVHAFDPTPKSVEWVRKQDFPPQFVLHEYGLADFDGTAQFFIPKNPNHVSHTLVKASNHSGEAITLPVKRLETIMNELDHDGLDLIKLDIEGAEYGFIEDLVAGTVRPRQLLVEFHHRFPTIGLGKTKEAVGQLRKMGYRLFSVSDSGEEYGFVL